MAPPTEIDTYANYLAWLEPIHSRLNEIDGRLNDAQANLGEIAEQMRTANLIALLPYAAETERTSLVAEIRSRLGD